MDKKTDSAEEAALAPAAQGELPSGPCFMGGDFDVEAVQPAPAPSAGETEPYGDGWHADLDFDAIVKAAAPAPSAGETGWQPIATAPMDTNVLLGWWRGWPAVEWEAKVGWAGSTRSHAGWLDGEAQFWMPLPKPAAPAAAPPTGETP